MEKQHTAPRAEERPAGGVAETHPLQPFLPAGARLCSCWAVSRQAGTVVDGVFLPQFPERHVADRGDGLLRDLDRFVVPGSRRFDRERIVAFCRERGIALYDTAAEVIRTRDNASDKFLEVVRPVDPAELLGRLPACRAVAVTGQRAADTFAGAVGCVQPPVGGCVEGDAGGAHRAVLADAPPPRAPTRSRWRRRRPSIAGCLRRPVCCKNRRCGEKRRAEREIRCCFA